jgi:hypothetical protein
LNFSPDPSKRTLAIDLEERTHTIDIQTSPQFEPEELEAAADVGSLLSGANSYTGGGTDYFSLVLAFLNFDPSGSLMKFSQMNKLLSRFRLLNINFGQLLSAYFQFSAQKFDPPTEESSQWVYDHSDGYYGKFSSGRVALDIFEYKIINVIIFLVSWTIKLISTTFLKEANRTGKITKGKCYFISIGQKIHLIAFNMLCLDLIIYGIRTVFHSENLGFWKNSISALLLALLVIDYSEIWLLGSDTYVSTKDDIEYKPLDEKDSPANESQLDLKQRAEEEKAKQEMDEKEKEKNGYVKILDQPTMIRKLRGNETV